jgi:hypothetical protein
MLTLCLGRSIESCIRRPPFVLNFPPSPFLFLVGHEHEMFARLDWTQMTASLSTRHLLTGAGGCPLSLLFNSEHYHWMQDTDPFNFKLCDWLKDTTLLTIT